MSSKSKSHSKSHSNSKSTTIMPNNFSALNIISLLVALAINGIVLYYVYQIEDKACECVIDWKHDYVKYVVMINLVFVVLVRIVPINQILLFIISIYSLFMIANIFIFYLYVHDLDKAQCVCIKAGGKDEKLHLVMYYYSYIPVILFAVGLLIGFLGSFMK